MMYRYLIYGLILFKVVVEALTEKNTQAGIVGFDVQLEWNLYGKSYSILKAENKITTKLENTIKYTHQLDDTRILLTITNVTLDDAGIYRCKLDDSGEYKDIELTVDDWGFKWISTTNPVVSRPHKDVDLVWKYQSRKMVNEITFTRYNNLTKEGHRIGVWTIKDGFKPDVRNVEMVKTTNKEVVELSLTLINAMKDDFNLIYICEVSDGANVNLKAIRLEKPIVYSKSQIIIDDVIEFEWQYEYDYPARAIIFTRHLNAEPHNIGYWKDGNFTPTLDGGQDRVEFQKTDIDDREAVIILKLSNAIEDDFRYNYTCKCVFTDRHLESAVVEMSEYRETTTAAVVDIVSDMPGKQPNGTNVYTLSSSDDGGVLIPVVIPVVIIMTVLVVIVVFVVCKRCNPQWNKLLYRLVNTTELNENYILHAVLNEDVEVTGNENEPVKIQHNQGYGSTSTTHQQTLRRRKLRDV